jgi:acetolactate synthase I/II/III large subunit
MSTTPGVPRGANALAVDSFLDALRRHGVEVMFGQSIPSRLHLRAPAYGMRQIGYRTENAGAAMADGYARISQKVGVVTAQNGPAATLLVPGLAEALKASVPIVALVQDVARPLADKNAFQELDHLELFKGCAKWIRRVERADRIEDYLDMAFTAAAGGRPGPAVLLCPLDLFDDAMPDPLGRGADLGRFPLDRSVADPARIEEAAHWLAGAETPLVIAGGGVHLSQAHDALADLQERFGLPVATTTMGKGGVAEDHPLSIGVAGYYMGPRGMARFHRELIEGADVILLIGTRTNQNGTDSWKLYPQGARYIHIDIDPMEIGRNYEALRLQGDARLTLEALARALDGQDPGKRRGGWAGLEKRIAEGRARHREEAAPWLSSSAVPIRPERLMGDLERVLSPETIVVADASYASIWIGNYLTSRAPGMRFLTPRGIAGLGWGLPLALGAKVAAPERPVLCVTGDGGFGHVWAELETARRMGLAVVLTVLNNQTLAYQRDAEDVLYGEYTEVCHFEPVDHAAIARACGLDGVRIEDPGDYLPALDSALASDRTTVLDVIVDPAAHPPITLFEGRLEGA